MIKRIVAVFGANAFGQVVNVCLRLISVSIFLHYWGKTLYGEWLILLTIPSYLALSGTGISTVAANEMAIHNSKGKEKESLGIFQSVWVFVMIISLLFFLIIVIVALAFPVHQWFQIKQTSPSQISLSLILLALYTVFLLQGELLVGVYRASGIFAKGIFANNIVSFLENIGVLVAATISHGIMMAIMVYVLIRITGTIFMARIILKKALWFHFGFKHARISTVRSSLMPTVSFVCINVSNAFLVQGIITVIGLTLGASAVVGYAVIRTVTNLVKQLNGMIYYSICPEFSTALAVDNKKLAKKLHR
ncbi:MAG TPA: hypothetical protein VGO09_03190 [Flavisolibacter sp.]|nr:hypothetical protein [Flavisolibacter sp.]